MPILQITSPHTFGKNDTATVMQWVLLATVPGIAMLLFSFGWGVISNIVIASVFALAFEAVAVQLRKQPIMFFLRDCSVLVTAILLAVALPPYTAWWVIAVGMFFSIIIAKHLYGGMGYNPFNPAMVGYVVLLISFPVEMTRWAAPNGLLDANTPNLIEAFGISLNLIDYPASTTINGIADGFTAATPLDLIRQNNALMMEDLYASHQQFGRWGGVGWEAANAGFLLGGLFLLYRRIYTWHAPLSMLLSLCLLSVIFYDGGSSNSAGSPLFHLFSGATMLGAWFIVTDPVSSAVSNKGRIIYGALIGALVFIIRTWGNYPDAVAFAVLLLNFAAPLIDHYTQPKTYGH